ncbi:molybdopterin molybdotransferase MoeA [Methanoregula formicica]|uniref:Molybdenum cofactor synthesis domain protein n=1 Tax=Methanoregula formicica (strain DSM 22288 / NBRC 105244 / SMSP) TaxID=593750 RepID=L0HCE4_METFS|nr:gephyrin-like molybdotransferase Glp [Methanoregula formicica]AGB01670.1 molybdenum cofactor synthesis domain protein [Methanoregula formicica SMSP]
MSRFFSVISVEDAVRTAERIAPPSQPEKIPIDTSAGRVLAADVHSDTDIPGFDRSVVDGYAVRSADTTGAGDSIPALLRCVGRVAMGKSDPLLVIGNAECAYIPTGGVLPQGADAAVMVEYTETAGDTVLVKKAASHGENIIRKDEDFRYGETVFTAGHRLTPQDTGVLSACGCVDVTVAKKPVVGIISTGNELVPADVVPGPGQVRDANAPMLAAWLLEYGCLPRRYGIAKDEREAFEAVIARAVAECDVVLLSGGSSKDDRDMTASVIASKGEVLVHGIALAPGKPTIIGTIGSTPVFGLPGHPASAFVVLIAIVRPLLDRMLGQSEPLIRTVRATLSENIPSQRGREEYVRVKVRDGIATPFFGKSGLLNTLVRSHGLIRIPAGFEGLEKGSTVDVILW